MACQTNRRLPRDIALTVLALLAVLVMANPGLLPGQETPSPMNGESMREQSSIDLVIERIRLYYGLGQYQQVITECRKLEQIDPGNKMCQYYKSRAETRLEEMGIAPPPPGMATPALTPAVPASTQPSRFPPEPTATSPSPALPGLPIPSSTSSETPVPGPFALGPGAPSASPTTAAPAPMRTEAPATERTPAPPPPQPIPVDTGPSEGGGGDFFASNKLMVIAIGGGLVVLLLIIILVFMIRNSKRKIRPVPAKPLDEPSRAAPAGFEKPLQAMEMPPVEVVGKPELPPLGVDVPELPTGDFPMPEVPPPVAAPEFPAPPAPEAAPSDFPPPPPPEPGIEGLPPAPEPVAAEIPLPPAPEIPAPEMPPPEDIPSPSTPGIPKTDDLPDIPSPTAYPASLETGEKPEPETPPDLPTFDISDLELPEASPEIQEEKGPELPPLSFEPEKEVVPSPPPVQTASDVEEFSFDLSDSEKEKVDMPVVRNNVEITPAPILGESGEERGTFEPEPEEGLSLEKSINGDQPPPSISIEEALGMEITPEEAPVEESPPQTEQKAATSMDLDSFLFDSGSEDMTETVLAVPKESSKSTPESPPSGESPEGAGEADSFDSLMFEEDSNQETVFATPEEILARAEADGPIAPPDKEEPKSERDIFTTESRDLADADSGPHVQREVQPSESEEGFPLDLKTPLPKAGEPRDFVNLEDMSGEEISKPKAPPRKKIEERNEVLFTDQYKKGCEAFENGDWKKAVHYLTVASAIKPDVKELKDMLTEARKKKRASG